MWKLVIEDDEGKRTVVPLSRDEYSVGRQEGNSVRLTERNVSRTHGRVRRKRGAEGGRDTFVLEDCESYNGVFVNGIRVATEQDLLHGDLIQIGDYRLVLQDDASTTVEQTEPSSVPAAPAAPVVPDVKTTVPVAPPYRASPLTERPNRLVMLVGPTPGVEYPLDRERLTVGRADDATVSVNHNSVSRLHCEIHALGDGRFEIVDKGSSNGVRVNAVELRRSIIEAGDTIELGDVRFKFVGAGQVFVPGPNESQQLTAISDREAELATPRRGLGGYAVPILGAGVVGGGIILAFVYVLRARAASDVGAEVTLPPATSAVVDTEQSLVTEAKGKCTDADCEEGHRLVSTLPATSIWRSSVDVRQIEATWAASVLKRADAEADPEASKKLLGRVMQAPMVDATQRQVAGDRLAALEQSAVPQPSAGREPPAPATQQAATTTARVTPPPDRTGRRPDATAATTVASAAPRPAPDKRSVAERASEAILAGKPWEGRQLLEGKGVRTGHGTPEEVRLLRNICKSPPDAACLDDLKKNYP
jgi:pSer/pThr/pTyr-binding forkhead associated (FHA) protein